MKISEWVSPGHPDKLADHISEYILDRMLEQDPNTRYALEVQVKDNNVTVGGEVTTEAFVNIPEAVRAAIRAIGYTNAYCNKWNSPVEANCIDPRLVEVETHINTQSPDIKQGVDAAGWGDQGIMFGMATNKGEYEHMPKDYYLARKIGQILYKRHGEYGIGIDIKTQVVLDDNKVTKVIVAAPMMQDRKSGIETLIRTYCGNECDIIINGTGKYVRHSSIADCGTTGRKLVVDFYGGNSKIGGGSPWTKDGTKADLTLNLYARYLALKYMLEHKGMPEIHVAIGCCIGTPDIDVTITDGTGLVLEEYTTSVTTNELIERFRLREPNYARMNKEGLFTIVDQMTLEEYRLEKQTV